MAAAIESRRLWKERLSGHPAHSLPPTGDPYVLGLWHKNRASLLGYYLQARVLVKSIFVRNRPIRFLMLGRPRSGTTLLRRLLNQVDGIHCDGEMLHHAVLWPHSFLNRLAGIKQTRAYGSKLLSYQMFEVQMIRDPAAFLERLVEDEYLLIHVRRDTFDQALSLSIAQAGFGYHSGAGNEVNVREVTLDPDEFVRQYLCQDAMLDYEDLLFSELPHLVVQYETALKKPTQHQAAIDRICAFLNVPSGPVVADLNKLSDRTVVTNIEVLRARVGSLNPTYRSML